VIETEGEARRALRVMLPIGVALRPGYRLFVDESEPMTGPYQLCQPVGCFSEYEASVELIGKLKKGQNLVLQAMQLDNQAITLFIPLDGFAEAYDGPPTDSQQFQQRREPRLFKHRREGDWPPGDYPLPSDRQRMFGR
jgi:invasion protein IalB